MYIIHGVNAGGNLVMNATYLRTSYMLQTLILPLKLKKTPRFDIRK